MARKFIENDSVQKFQNLFDNLVIIFLGYENLDCNKKQLSTQL